MDSLLGFLSNSDISEDVKKIESESVNYTPHTPNGSSPATAAAQSESKAIKSENDDSSSELKIASRQGMDGVEKKTEGRKKTNSYTGEAHIDRLRLKTYDVKRSVQYTSAKVDELINTLSTVLEVSKTQFSENIINSHFKDNQQPYERLYQEWLKDHARSLFDK